MTKRFLFFGAVFLLFLAFSTTVVVRAQTSKETYSGTILSYGSGLNTRTTTRLFRLDIKEQTSDSQAQNFLGILQESGQSKLLDAIDNQEIGRFSVGSNLGVPVNVIRESTVDGKRRIFVVFKRWTEFAELRGGYRSLDYPFGVIEIYVDERTGKGEGTYIAAAQIRMKRSDNGQYNVEIENFATFPAKLLGVRRN